MNVSGCTVYRSFNSFLRNLHVVEVIQASRQPTQNANGRVMRRLVNADTIEAAHQCAILFKGFVELFPSSRSDDLESALSDSRLDHVSKVRTAVTRVTCTLHSVCFVNEENRLLLSIQCFKNVLDLFFEVTAITRTS